MGRCSAPRIVHNRIFGQISWCCGKFLFAQKNEIHHFLLKVFPLQEDPFEKFSHWCDLASVGEDDEVLAIPQHRIQYFKYRDTKVWDKPSRTDMIFGSTSTQDHDINEVLTKIDVE